MKQSSTPRLTLALYWQHIGKRRRQLFNIVVSNGLGTVAQQFIAPLLVANAFNILTRNRGRIDGFWHTFGWMLLLYAGLLVFSNIMWRLSIWLLWNFEVEIKRELAIRCFSFLANQSVRFHTNRFGGSLVSQTNKFVSAFERLFDEFAFTAWTNVVAFVATILILLPKAPLYIGCFLIISTIYMTIVGIRTKKQQPTNVAVSDAESAETAQLADMITNFQTVKTFAHEDLESKLFIDKADKIAKAEYASRDMVTFNETFYSFLNHGQNWLALFFGLYAVTGYHSNISTLYLITTYTFNLLERLWQFGRLMRNLTRAFGDAHDMTQMLQLGMEVVDKPNAKQLTAIRGDIRFNDMAFAYPEADQEALFKEFNLHIKPGEKVGLVGQSGGGKTTLTKLLLRFMDINDGAILIDGQNIADVTQKSLRQSVAYVPQEPLMFHRTIADNIRYGQLEASDEAIVAAAKMSNSHEFIVKLPKGYKTYVGERGTKLSGGQRQRVAIARAMLKNAPILVLDEATSALDSESEVLIQDALWRLMEGRTAIVIAHRLSTIQKMDRIIVLEDGKVVEQGSHKDLLRLNGTYAKLWSHQSGGFMNEDAED